MVENHSISPTSSPDLLGKGIILVSVEPLSEDMTYDNEARVLKWSGTLVPREEKEPEARFTVMTYGLEWTQYEGMGGRRVGKFVLNDNHDDFMDIPY